MEDEIFQKFREDSYRQLFNLKPTDIKPYDFSLGDEAYTFVARFDQAVTNKITDFIQELKKVEASHLFYTSEQLHLTIIGGIPAVVSENHIIEDARPLLTSAPMKFSLQGVGSNQFVVSINAQPLGFSIHELREKLRNAIGVHGTDYTIHLLCYEYRGWINFLRYLHTPKLELIEALRENVDRGFGELVPASIELYKGRGSVLDEHYELIYTFQ